MRDRKHQLLRRLRAADEGFTLAEMLVALAIISGALLALLGGFITSARSLQSQQEQSRAQRVALDINEGLRLEGFDAPALTIGTPHVVKDVDLPVERRNGCGTKYTCTTTVTERDSRPDSVVPGDIIKDVRTEIQYKVKGVVKTATYVTAVAQDARTIGLPSGYIKAITGVTVSPNPSTIVDFDGRTEDDIDVTVVMTGFEPDNTVKLSWTDSSARSKTVTSTDGRHWRFKLPKKDSTNGLALPLEIGQSRVITFTASALSGLTRTSSLTVFGPATNRPLVATWTVTPSPIQTFKNGNNRFENKSDVTLACTIDWVKDATDERNSVKASYIGETGSSVEQVLSRTSISGTRATYSHVFKSGTAFFGRGDNLPFSCVGRRFLDGGPASRSVSVSVK